MDRLKRSCSYSTSMSTFFLTFQQGFEVPWFYFVKRIDSAAEEYIDVVCHKA